MVPGEIPGRALWVGLMKHRALTSPCVWTPGGFWGYDDQEAGSREPRRLQHRRVRRGRPAPVRPGGRLHHPGRGRRSARPGQGQACGEGGQGGGRGQAPQREQGRERGAAPPRGAAQGGEPRMTEFETDDDDFEDDLEDAETLADEDTELVDDDDPDADELRVGDLDDEEELVLRPGAQAGAEDDPEADQEVGVREPEGETS